MRRALLVIVALVGLVACGGPATTPTANVAPTQTRAAEMAQIATLTAPTATIAATSTPPPPTATAIPPTPTLRPPLVIPPTATKGGPTPPPPITRPVAVVVNKLIDPADGTKFPPVNAGLRRIAVDITMTNTSSLAYHYHVYNVRLKTTDDREYDAGSGGPVPDFSYGDLAPGESVRAYLAFDIIVGIQPKSFIYTPDKGDRVIVPVR
jgi:hypothetical protein